ncbi:MAG: YecA family protein [Thermodesulfovibrio sp.]|nr:YecA family protein [Thermodesulfovibrio sp.]MDW7972736.1 UPF0149 family protein [Thermodesulfovibrio sp.]
MINEKVFTLTELEGFLFGLAITPDLISINEWMPMIFGEDTYVFESEILFKSLIESYNAYSDAFHKDTLL